MSVGMIVNDCDDGDDCVAVVVVDEERTTCTTGNSITVSPNRFSLSDL